MASASPGPDIGSIPAHTVTRSITASKAKLGFEEFKSPSIPPAFPPSFPPKFYLRQVETEIGNWHWDHREPYEPHLSDNGGGDSDISIKTTSNRNPLSGLTTKTGGSATGGETGAGHSYKHSFQNEALYTTLPQQYGLEEQTWRSSYGPDCQWTGTFVGTYNGYQPRDPVNEPYNESAFSYSPFPSVEEGDGSSTNTTDYTLTATKEETDQTGIYIWHHRFDAYREDFVNGDGEDLLTKELSNEYTFDQLGQHVDALLAAGSFGELAFGKGWSIEYDDKGTPKKTLGGSTGAAFCHVSRELTTNRPDEKTLSKAKLEYKLTAAIPPANGTDSFVFRWRHRITRDDNNSVTYEYFDAGPITPAQGATVVETPAYPIEPPNFYGAVSVESYLVDIDPFPLTNEVVWNEQTEDNPGVPITRERDGFGGVIFLAYHPGVANSSRTISWREDLLKVFKDYSAEEIHSPFTIADGQPTPTLIAFAKDSLVDLQKTDILVVGHDMAGENIGEDHVTVFVPRIEIEAYAPGTKSAPGPKITPPADPNEPPIVLYTPNDDDDDHRRTEEAPDGDPEAGNHADNDDETIGENDDDIVKLTLHFNAGGMKQGKVYVSMPYGIRVFSSDGSVISNPEDFTVNLSDPSGKFAPLITDGQMDVFVEGLPGGGAGTMTVNFFGHRGMMTLAPVEVLNAYPSINPPPLRQGAAFSPRNRTIPRSGPAVSSDGGYYYLPVTSGGVTLISAHGKNGLDPAMPNLLARTPDGTGSTMKVKWKLVVTYERENGDSGKDASKQDTVTIPADGAPVEVEVGSDWKIFDHPDWINALGTTGRNFFGGKATLTYIQPGTANAPGKVEFIIGGENPDPVLCRQYIDDHATSAKGNAVYVKSDGTSIQHHMWFAYAIAKHESKGYNDIYNRAGNVVGRTIYSQFWDPRRFDYKNPQLDFFPIWRKKKTEDSAGGFGMFQVTGDKTSQFGTIPRQQLWNWQSNVNAALAIIRDKRHENAAVTLNAFSWMNSPTIGRDGLPEGQREQAKQQRGGVNFPVPDHKVQQTTFSDIANSTKVIEDAVNIKLYNGAQIEYCSWDKKLNNKKGGWKFSPTGNYVNNICTQIDN